MKSKHLAITCVLVAGSVTPPLAADVLERSTGPLGELWQKTQDAAGSAWNDAKRLVQGQDEQGFAYIWEEITPKLEQALSLSDRQQTLPEKSWFGADQVSNQASVDELLDEAIQLLALAPATQYRQRIRQLDAEVRETRAAIAEYRRKQIGAPDDALLRKSAEDYRQAIQDAEARIEALLHERAEIQQRFAAELYELGIVVSDEQLEFLLSTVIGDDLIDMGVAFDNVKAITQQLEQLMAETREDLSSARRYYGMYTILLKTLARMQQQLISDVEQRYIPEIDTIIGRTRQLSQDTRSLLQQAESAKHEVLQANIEAQQLTLRTADLYRRYLLGQAAELKNDHKRLQRDVAIAVNTYETVKVSGELVQLMKSSRQLLETLLSRQPPALQAFRNLEMKREFEKLTQQLRREGQ